MLTEKVIHQLFDGQSLRGEFSNPPPTSSMGALFREIEISNGRGEGESKMSFRKGDS